jgi:hypothetical protein
MNSSDELLGRPDTINVQLEFFWKSDIARYAEFSGARRKRRERHLPAWYTLFGQKSFLKWYNGMSE